MQHLAGHEGGLWRRQVADGGGDVDRFPGPGRRRLRDDPPPPLVGDPGAEELRAQDQAGRDRVDGDAFGAKLPGQGVGQPDQPGLGRAVHVTTTAEGGDRADVQDPSARPSQDPSNGVHHEVGAHQVGREHGVGVAGGGGDARPGWQRACAGAAPRVVHEDVERVRHLPGEPGHEGLDLGRVAHVTLPPPDAIHRPSADLGRRVREDLGAPPQEHREVAVGGEGRRDGPSDARARARDHDRSTRQSVPSWRAAPGYSVSCAACSGSVFLSSGRVGSIVGPSRGAIRRPMGRA